MKRTILYAILIILCYILQVSVFSFFKMAGIGPNILLILVVSFAIMRGQVEGMMIGFFCGLIWDIFGGDTIGFYALIFVLLGYFNGLLHQVFYSENILLPLFMILINSFVYSFIVYVCGFLLRNKRDFSFYFMKIVMPEVVYTFLIAVFLYNIFLWMNKLLERFEKRSTV